MKNNFSKETITKYLSERSKIWGRCREITEYYYEAKLWIRGINYISEIDVTPEKVVIYEGAHGCDLEFRMEDFIDTPRLLEAIHQDIEEYQG